MGTHLFLSGCSMIPRPEPEVKVVTKVEKTQVPVVERPKPVQLVDTKVYVVNQENLEQFIVEFKEQHGELAFVGLSIKDYENLALNIADIRRYVNQQKEIILYYEQALTPEANKDDVTVSETELK
jgi:hypothetical protein